MLLGILPPEGDLTTIRIVRELREGLSFSEAEHRDLQMVQEDNQLRWAEGATPAKVLDIGPKAQEVIRGAIKKLDDDKKLVARANRSSELGLVYTREVSELAGLRFVQHE